MAFRAANPHQRFYFPRALDPATSGNIRQHRPHCIIGNFGASSVTMIVGWLMRVPRRINWYHTHSDAYALGASIPKWKLRYLIFRKRLVCQLATHIIANSYAARDDAHRAFGVPLAKCHAVYYALDISKPEDQEPIPDDAPFVCAGRLHIGKGQDIVLNAISLLKSRFPEKASLLKVEFLADGATKNDLIAMASGLNIAENCTFMGLVTPDQVLHHMSRARAVLVPSRAEAFSLVAAEAIAMGTPAIVSNVGCLPEIEHDGVNGFVIPMDDPVALAEKMAVLIRDGALRAGMSTNARQ